MQLLGLHALHESTEDRLTLGEGGEVNEVEVGGVRQQHAQTAGPGWEGPCLINHSLCIEVDTSQFSQKRGNVVCITLVLMQSQMFTLILWYLQLCNNLTPLCPPGRHPGQSDNTASAGEGVGLQRVKDFFVVVVSFPGSTPQYSGTWNKAKLIPWPDFTLYPWRPPPPPPQRFSMATR